MQKSTIHYSLKRCNIYVVGGYKNKIFQNIKCIRKKMHHLRTDTVQRCNTYIILLFFFVLVKFFQKSIINIQRVKWFFFLPKRLPHCKLIKIYSYKDQNHISNIFQSNSVPSQFQEFQYFFPSQFQSLYIFFNTFFLNHF